MSLLFVCGFFPFFLEAQSLDTLSQAEELYRHGKFSAALTIYEQELKTHPNDPFVYYNIGNCYFKMGSRGLAVANYYRAFKLAPRDTDIRHNLALALSASGERLTPAGMPEILHKTFFGLSYAELKGLCLVLFWLFCSLACIWLLKRRFGKVCFVSLLLLGISLAWFYCRHSLETRTLAVVASPTAEIRSGPGVNFPASANMTQGHLVVIQDEKDSWYQVVIPAQGLKGWVEKGTVEKI